MKNKAYRTDIRREILYTFNRFLCIFLIVALGVAFFAGIRATEPDMRKSADKFYDENNLMDLQVISTGGLTNNDAEAISAIPGIEEVMPYYAIDMLENSGEEQHVLKVMSIPEGINRITVVEGRLPENEHECIADTRITDFFGEYRIGEVIKVEAGNGEESDEILTENELTIVGKCITPYYLSFERESSKLGNGSVLGFIMINKECFKQDYYSNIYVTGQNFKKMMSYSEEYEEAVDALTQKIKDIAEKRCTARYDEFMDEAEEKIAAAEEELSAEVKKSEDEIAEEEKKAEEEFEQNKKETEAKLTAAEDEITAKLAAAESEIETRMTTAETEMKTKLAMTEMELNNQEISAKEKRAMLMALEEEMKSKLQASEIEMKSKLEETETIMREQLDVNASEAGEKLAEAELEIKNKIGDARKELQDKSDEAREKIAEERRRADEIEKPEWYVLDRGYIETCAEYGENSKRIGAIGKVFPVIFFLVAILVCLTTMTRMVEEQRTQIGTMKAMGYSSVRIAWKYLLYSLLSSVFGSIFGAVVGQLVLPYSIMKAYFILYDNLPYLLTDIDITLGVKAGVIACACTTFATLAACARALRSNAAELMRPVAPAPGKRVFMERISFIWKRLNFTAKAGIRNLFRYKKRFFMTVIGISGCMGLLLVGFGLHDSIFTIIDNQFYRITHYDGVISLTDVNKNVSERLSEEAAEGDEYTEGNRDDLYEFLENEDTIADTLEVFQTSMDVGFNDNEKSASIIVPYTTEGFDSYIYLGDRVSKEQYSLEEMKDTVVMSEKLSILLGVKEGDTIYLKDDGRKRAAVKVGAITENYVFHYIYMTTDVYTSLFGELPECNMLYFLMPDGAEEDDSFNEQVLEMDSVSGIKYIHATEETVYDMMSSLDFVVYVLIISAGLLAFVVLYNLSSININERRRELATLKVLGFYDGEVSAYVYRENVMLTLIGTAAGIVFGVFLHRYVITTAEVDITMFGRDIKPLSYVYSTALTIGFSVLVNWVMHYKLKKIDMVESLKSIE